MKHCKPPAFHLQILFLLPWLLGVLAVQPFFAAAPTQLGDVIIRGAATIPSGGSITSASGSAIDLSLGTVTLPSDVSRLGSSISLTTEVTGQLPVANGGTGTASPALVAGAGITISGTWPGQTIASTLGTTVDLGSEVGATILPLANGGTGTATPALVAGTNITITGTWPNQTINASVTASPADLLSTLVNSEISITTTATATISTMHVCSGTSADYTVTLPAVSGNTGKLIGFRMSNALTKLVTIKGNASENIDGQNTRVMWKNETAILLCDGSTWTKIAGKSIPMVASITGSGGTSFQSLSSSTVTKVSILQTAALDNTGRMADTANKRINIVRAGNYQISGAVQFGATFSTPLSATSNRTIAFIYQNAANTISQGEVYGTSGGFPSPVTLTTYPLAVSDYLELNAFLSTGSNGVIGGASTQLNAAEIPNW